MRFPQTSRSGSSTPTTSLISMLSIATLAAAATCPLPDTYRWNSTGALANPKSGWASLKDFTTVPYQGKHLVYATTHDTGSTWGSMNFGLVTNWSELASAPQNKMNYANLCKKSQRRTRLLG